MRDAPKLTEGAPDVIVLWYQSKLMADQRITDANGKTIGFIKDSSGGNKIVTDANGSMKGRYDGHNDKTFSATGSYIGLGNQLMRLLGK